MLINGATALRRVRGREADLNVPGAYLLKDADVGMSVGVMPGGIGMRWTGRA